MNRSLVIYSGNQQSKLFSWNPYLLGLLVCYLIIAFAVLMYLQMPPKYASQFSLVLPGTGSSSKVTLEEVGQVQQSSTSAFGSHAFSPLSNYKQILLSASVRDRAASRMGIEAQALIQPKVQVLQQTSIIGVKSFSGDAHSAQEQAWALYEVFQEELSRLRLDEIARYEASVEGVLSVHKERMSKARKAIIDFQQRSLLISLSQVEQLVATLNKVQEDLTFSQSERHAQTKFVNRLSEHLGVSPLLAGKALSLQSDAQFAGYIAELNATAAQLSRFTSQWGEEHPKVLAEQQRFDVVLSKLASRSSELVGIHSAKILHGMNLNASLQLSELFSQLLDAGAKLEGLNAKINELTLAEARIDDQLRIYSREAAELERLEREHQRAEAIYNAAAARLESSKSDIFSSYPVVQLLEVPSLPGNNQSPRLGMALIIGGLGVFIVTIGIGVIWQRDRLIKILLKKS